MMNKGKVVVVVVVVVRGGGGLKERAIRKHMWRREIDVIKRWITEKFLIGGLFFSCSIMW